MQKKKYAVCVSRVASVLGVLVLVVLLESISGADVAAFLVTKVTSQRRNVSFCERGSFAGCWLAKNDVDDEEAQKHRPTYEDKEVTRTFSGKFLEDNGIELLVDERTGSVSARGPPPLSKDQGPTTTEVTKTKTATPTRTRTPLRKRRRRKQLLDHPTPKIGGSDVVNGFNVVLTHSTADFDTLASAVGLAKLWSSPRSADDPQLSPAFASDSTNAHPTTHNNTPTYVVLPRGAHPTVQRFLALHKHLFPIRSLRSISSDLPRLNRLGLVDAQRRDRIQPAQHLLSYAKRVTVVDHHIDSESDIPEATDYVVDQVGSVSTMVVERLRQARIDVSDAEATLLALGIHADTGNLCYDSTTPRDAKALAWLMEQGASQPALAEHAQSSLSAEQQGVLTQALINTNSSVVHGVTVSTVLLSSEGYINGLAAVTQDALELSGSDVLLLALVYDAKSGSSKRKKKSAINAATRRLTKSFVLNDQSGKYQPNSSPTVTQPTMSVEAWKGGEEALKRRRLRASFERKDVDGSGYLERNEMSAALATAGVIASQEAIDAVMALIDLDGDGRVDFDEFVKFSSDVEKKQHEQDQITGHRASTMIIIGRVKSGVSVRSVNLNTLFRPFGGGGHAKAASATVRLNDEGEAGPILEGLVEELTQTSLLQQPTVGDFMTAPVLSAKPSMTEKQVEDLFTRYDVRALPVVDDGNNVIGLVTYKEVAAAKQRLWNKEQKRLQRETQMQEASSENSNKKPRSDKHASERRLGSALKGWMKQHVRLVEAGMTMAEVEAVLLENDVGCIPVVADGTKQLVGMVTRTDLLRQHRYYPSLYYHNKGFSDSIAGRKHIIELRKKLKRFDVENE